MIDAYRIVKARASRGAARAGRLDGARRPGGLGLLQPHRQPRGRRPRHPHPQQPATTSARSRSTPSRSHSDVVLQKSITRGLRPDRSRRRSGRRGRWSAAASAGSSPQIEDGETGWLVDSRRQECAQACLEILADPAGARDSALARQGVRARATSSRRGCCATGSCCFNRLAGNDTAGAEVTSRPSTG